jgi:peptidoglycan/LPS O-acetylase OafA/YrhL
MTSNFKVAPGSSPTTRVFGLDFLRASAVLAVVAGHTGVLIYTHVPNFGYVGQGGFYGTELFFVLSGFLIGGILLRESSEFYEPVSLGVFYVRRWFRTLPLFWLFILLNVWIEGSLRSHPLQLGEITGHAFFLRTFSVNRLSFMPESWSLAVEEWFYLLFPAALWAGTWMFRRFEDVFVGTAAGFFLFSTAVRFASASHPQSAWSWWERMIVLYRFDAIMIGAIAAWLARRWPSQWRRSAGLCLVTGLAILTILYASLWMPRLGGGDSNGGSFFARTLRFNFVSLGFSLLLPACSLWFPRRETALTLGVRKIALWSYAMYLVQIPAINVLDRLIAPRWKTSMGTSIVLWFGELAAITATAGFLFYIYERPCTRLREKVAPVLARLIPPRSHKRELSSAPCFADKSTPTHDA